MIVTICQVRYDSTRLPGKAVKKINGIEIIDYIIKSMEKSTLSDLIFLACPDTKKDRSIFKNKEIDVFFGSEYNLLKRYVDCINYIEKNFGKVKHIVRLTGDCPLLYYADNLIDIVINKHLIERNDFTRNRGKNGNPSGFDVEVFTKELLVESYEKGKKEEEKEHINMYVKNNYGNYKIGELEYFFNCNIGNKKNDNYNFKWSVDDNESLERIEDLILLIESNLISLPLPF